MSEFDTFSKSPCIQANAVHIHCVFCCCLVLLRYLNGCRCVLVYMYCIRLKCECSVSQANNTYLVLAVLNTYINKTHTNSTNICVYESIVFHVFCYCFCCCLVCSFVQSFVQFFVSCLMIYPPLHSHVRTHTHIRSLTNARCETQSYLYFTCEHGHDTQTSI